ncbi:MAG: HgcAB-like fusion protein, partial [Sedimentisphaerales bacterium]
MSLLKYVLVNVIGTVLRIIPLPCKTGLIRIGNPNSNSPVFLTCNYRLTVERVKRALRTLDAYLLVGNSKGLNVWCASIGGHFTNHGVISVLKTTGIEEIVGHRNVILPQLAAGGVEAGIIQKKTGWKVIWGPVYAKDIQAFVENNFKKTSMMRQVRFRWDQRIEMGATWAFPFSVIVAVITALFWHRLFLPLTVIVWTLPFLIFLFFPVYSGWLNPRKKGTSFSKYTFVFDFGFITLILWGFFVCCLIIYSILAGTFNWKFILTWGFISFIIVLIISLDLMGSTPVY